MLLFIEQFLNGLQFGLLLFLLAAGLTLVFGIMDLVNLAHGSLYMIGAYFAATFAALTGSFVLAIVLALIATLIVGMAVEVIALRRLYGRDHLDHVLAHLRPDPVLQRDGAADLGAGRLEPAAAGLAQHQFRDFPRRLLPDLSADDHRGRACWSRFCFIVVIMRTRVGMLIRAGASNREMIGALGINIKLLYTFVFGIGAALAGLAGMMQAPILTVQIGMGENILILAFVVIIIGGIGSIRGAFVASILVGLIDTVGRAFLPDVLKLFLSNAAASTAGPALSSMLIYLVMAVILVVRPAGLVPGGQQMTERLHRPQHRRRALLDFPCAGAGLFADDRQRLHHDAVHAHRDSRDRRRQPQSHHGLWRHGDLRPRRLSRHRRLRGRHPRA